MSFLLATARHFTTVVPTALAEALDKITQFGHAVSQPGLRDAVRGWSVKLDSPK